MGGGKTLFLVIKPWAVFILAVLMAGFSTGHGKHVGERKLTSTIDRPGSISIDCGVNNDYLDEQSGIYYKSDSGFITAGENRRVSQHNMVTHPYLGQTLLYLRSFPNGAKNCYSLKPEQGKGHNYMVRVFFYYGNYDGKDDPPTFDVYLGVNYWTTVTLVSDSENLYSAYEIIQFLRTDTIDVCLVNTGFGIPIISALELRLLNNSIYQIGSKVLSLRKRFDMIVDNFSSR
ncbi:hypothetical protein SLE2022_384230 [Rubroshorea leprosula]